MVVVDARLPDGHDLGMAREVGQGRKEIKPFLHHVGRVDPDRGVEVGEALREGHGASTALDACPDRDDPRDTRFTSPRHDPVEVRFEIGIVEVGVSIDQFHGKMKKLK